MPFDRLNPNEYSYKGKLVLRCIAFGFATIAIIPAAVSWRISIFVLPVIILSWLWNLINIVKRLRSAYPVHPGANVAFDLLLWMLFTILGGFNIMVAVFAIYIDKSIWSSNPTFVNQWGSMSVCTIKTTTDEDGEETTSRVCSVPQDSIDLVRILGRASLIAIGIAGVVSILHFILFIWACVDTHRYRRDRRETIAAFRAKQNEFSTEH